MIRDPNETIGKMIDQQELGFIASVDEKGFPTMKVMLNTRKREGLKYLYFLTMKDAKRTIDYKRNPKGCVYFYDRQFFHGVMLQGDVEVLEDKELIQELASDIQEDFFISGKQHEELCVLKFRIETGRYFSNKRAENFEVVGEE